MLDPKIFKAYDVRGVYPDELDEEGAYAIGRAYVEQFEPRRIAVGRDMRLSSPRMQAAVIRGATDAGAYVELQGTAEGRPFDRAAATGLLDLADGGLARLFEAQAAVLATVRR